MTEPLALTLAEICSHLRLEIGEDDAKALAFARAAQTMVEKYTGQVMARQVRVSEVEEIAWPLEIHAFPVFGVTIERVDGASVIETVDPASYYLSGSGPYLLQSRTPGAASLTALPGERYRLSVDCGYPAGTCPEALKTACLMMAAQMDKYREASAEKTYAQDAFQSLIAPYRLRVVY